MLHLLFVLTLFVVSTVSSKEAACSSEEFLKTFQCIGGLAEFVAKVDTFNLTVAGDRTKFLADCKVASDCFGPSSECLHADRLRLFLDTYCHYSTFLETDFKVCKDKLDAREETQCEKSFKSFFDNSKTEEVKCNELDKSMICVQKEVSEVCGESDASNIGKYLVDMSKGLSCDEAKKKAAEKNTA